MKKTFLPWFPFLLALALLPRGAAAGSPTPSGELTGDKKKGPSAAELRAIRGAFSSTGGKGNPAAVPSAAPKASAVSSQSRPNSMNPQISALGVFALGWTSHAASGHCHADGVCHGDVGLFGHTHDPARTGISLQQVELDLSADVDPYFTAMVVLSFGEGIASGEVEIEEAYLKTLSLPWQLQLKGGKFLSALSRLASQHLHNLDFVNASLPVIMGLGGEMSHYAVQLTWLLPLPFYLRLGVEGSYGGSMAFPVTDPSRPVLLGHIKAYFDLGASLGLLIGGGVANGVWAKAESNAADLSRTVVDGYLRLKWRPPGRGNYRSLVVMGEYIGSWSRCAPEHLNSGKPQYRQVCLGRTVDRPAVLHGVVGKVVLRFAQRWRTGVRFDWAQQREPSPTRPENRISAMVDFSPSEFSRFRLQYDGANLLSSTESAHAVWLQFQFSIGTHGAHAY